MKNRILMIILSVCLLSFGCGASSGDVAAQSNVGAAETQDDSMEGGGETADTKAASADDKDDTVADSDDDKDDAGADSDEDKGSEKAGKPDKEAAQSDKDKVADSSDYAKGSEIDDKGLTPVAADELNDGEYDISMQSSSSMFKVAESTLVVSGGTMEAVLRIESDSYLYMYAGSAEEAAAAPEEELINFNEDEKGDQLYAIPVEALDKALPYAAYSRKKEQWYDRTLLFESSSLPEEAFKEARYKTAADLGLADGTYYMDVTLEGGSGKASVDSPAVITVKDGKAEAVIVWSSDNYDYMIVDGEKYFADTSGGASSFVIPVKGFGYKMSVVADTTAMSKPYEIDYTLYFDPDTIKEADPAKGSASFDGLKKTGEIKGEYATGFTVTSYEGDIHDVRVGEDEYLLVPKKGKLPANIPEDVTVIRTPVEKAYVASTSSMDFFTRLDSLDRVASAGAEASKWTDDTVADKVKKGEIAYEGKYDTPDYESLLIKGTDVAIENTMIYHSPETKEKLEELSIPVFVDMTSYEEDPRGRVEWIKLYGLLTGEYDKADSYFKKCCDDIDKVTAEVSHNKDSKPKVVFFYISPKGHVGVRNPEDYLSRMTEMAGGINGISDLKLPEGGHASSVNISMEDFYLKGRDADILIYESTLYGMPKSMDQLMSDTALLSEFKAFKEGRVYATEDTIFQATCEAADMIADLSDIISGRDRDMTYFKKLK